MSKWETIVYLQMTFRDIDVSVAKAGSKVPANPEEDEQVIHLAARKVPYNEKVLMLRMRMRTLVRIVVAVSSAAGGTWAIRLLGFF